LTGLGICLQHVSKKSTSKGEDHITSNVQLWNLLAPIHDT
jgi:hypothetical protein